MGGVEVNRDLKQKIFTFAAIKIKKFFKQKNKKI